MAERTVFRNAATANVNHPESYLALAIIQYTDDSPTLAQALKGTDCDAWKAGIRKELDTLWSTGTWSTISKSQIPAEYQQKCI